MFTWFLFHAPWFKVKWRLDKEPDGENSRRSQMNVKQLKIECGLECIVHSGHLRSLVLGGVAGVGEG